MFVLIAGPKIPNIKYIYSLKKGLEHCDWLITSLLSPHHYHLHLVSLENLFIPLSNDGPFLRIMHLFRTAQLGSG